MFVKRAGLRSAGKLTHLCMELAKRELSGWRGVWWQDTGLNSGRFECEGLDVAWCGAASGIGLSAQRQERRFLPRGEAVGRAEIHPASPGGVSSRGTDGSLCLQLRPYGDCLIK